MAEAVRTGRVGRGVRAPRVRYLPIAEHGLIGAVALFALGLRCSLCRARGRCYRQRASSVNANRTRWVCCVGSAAARVRRLTG